MLSPAFEGLNVDRILKKLDDPSIEPGYVDPRHCMVFWARPPQHIKDLVDQIQQKLKRVSPGELRLEKANVEFVPNSFLVGYDAVVVQFDVHRA